MIKFIELQNFGVNLLTFTFVITLIFTALSAYALFKQNQKIVKSRSGESVSFIFFSYYAFSALAVIIYGVAKNSLALTINGVIGFIALAIIINLWRFKKISLKEKIIGLSSILTIPIIILSNQKDLLFIIFGVVIGLTMIEQITEIWTNKSSGSVYLGQIIVSLSSTSFWLIYAIVINLWSMEIVNSIGVLLWLILLFSYLKFKPKKINIKNRDIRDVTIFQTVVIAFVAMVSSLIPMIGPGFLAYHFVQLNDQMRFLTRKHLITSIILGNAILSAFTYLLGQSVKTSLLLLVLNVTTSIIFFSLGLFIEKRRNKKFAEAKRLKELELSKIEAAV